MILLMLIEQVVDARVLMTWDDLKDDGKEREKVLPCLPDKTHSAFCKRVCSM